MKSAIDPASRRARHKSPAAHWQCPWSRCAISPELCRRPLPLVAFLRRSRRYGLAARFSASMLPFASS